MRITGQNEQCYFWRNYNQQGVDLIEVKNGQPAAFEIKYSPDKKVKKPAAFATAYPDIDYQVITKDNYLDWILDDKQLFSAHHVSKIPNRSLSGQL